MLNANISHEMSTPLNCIHQMAQRLIKLMEKESKGLKLTNDVSLRPHHAVSD
jgi:hypothetical protein